MPAVRASVSPRRALIPLIVLTTILWLSCYQEDRIGVRLSSLPKFGSSRKPLLGSEDLWAPPANWNPLSSVYDNFTSIDEQYSSSVSELKNGWHPKPRPAQPYSPISQSRLAALSTQARVPCKGPRGVRLDQSEFDEVLRYKVQPQHFAQGPLGSSDEIGFERDACYERRGRFAPYGYHDWNDTSDVDWDKVDWAALQNQCVSENSARFDLDPRPDIVDNDYVKKTVHKVSEKTSRTAVVFRSHQHQVYNPDLLRNMRAVIQELSLRSGGEYQAFLLVEIKDYDLHIWDDSELYQQLIDTLVPREFRNMTVLWNEWRWRDEYPMLPEDTLLVHKSQWLPIQLFQKLYPEFDYYWNWEMDVRYTGHYYDLVKSVVSWSTAQPRKGLWERSARFYIPKLHGSHEQYRLLVQDQYRNESEDSSIWGPLFPPGGPSADQSAWLSKLDVLPPVPSPAQDKFKWGVGESPDFITFLPMFDPDTTKYVYQDAYFNYPGEIDSADMPRRTTIITFSRVSARLLRLMELENTTPPGHHVSSESWPQTVALHYGLKAATVPHSIYMEKSWPAQALDWIFNNGDHLPHLPEYQDLDPRGEGAGGPESTFGLEREHNWGGSTWYYQNRLAERLYKRWLGWETDGIGGSSWESTHGKFCLPPMLLHPIKAIEDPAFKR